MTWMRKFAGREDETRGEMEARLERVRRMVGEAEGLVQAARGDLLRWLGEMERRCRVEGASLRMIESVSDRDLVGTWGFLIGAIGTYRTAEGNLGDYQREVEDMVRTLADGEVWK